MERYRTYPGAPGGPQPPVTRADMAMMLSLHVLLLEARLNLAVEAGHAELAGALPALREAAHDWEQIEGGGVPVHATWEQVSVRVGQLLRLVDGDGPAASARLAWWDQALSELRAWADARGVQPPYAGPSSTAPRDAADA